MVSDGMVRWGVALIPGELGKPAKPLISLVHDSYQVWAGCHEQVGATKPPTRRYHPCLYLELVEVSVQGPLGVTEDSVSVGDSEEWEDVW
jgi:hypothetical protein